MQLKPQISQRNTDDQGMLHFGPFTLRVDGSQVLLDLQFAGSVSSVSSVVNLIGRIQNQGSFSAVDPATSRNAAKVGSRVVE